VNAFVMSSPVGFDCADGAAIAGLGSCNLTRRGVVWLAIHRPGLPMRVSASPGVLFAARVANGHRACEELIAAARGTASRASKSATEAAASAVALKLSVPQAVSRPARRVPSKVVGRANGQQDRQACAVEKGSTAIGRKGRRASPGKESTTRPAKTAVRRA
jgi:hypothetical protein